MVQVDSARSSRRIANRVNNALSFGAVSKALRALDDIPMIDIKSAQAKAALTALPEGYVGVDYVPSSNTTGLEPATEEEMRKALFGTLNKKAPGASGLGPVQLKAMKQNDEFIRYITQAYNELMTHPDAMSDVMALFEFRAVLIPPDSDRRNNHKYLPSHTTEAPDQACEQIAFKKNAYPVGIRRAHELISRAGMQAISLDIKNAFDSVPRAEVIRALNEAGAPLVLIGYVKCEVWGLPQGDPLSMFLPCMAFERLLRKHRSRACPGGRRAGGRALRRAPAPPPTPDRCACWGVSRRPAGPSPRSQEGIRLTHELRPGPSRGAAPTTGADAEHQPRRANSK